MDTLRTHRRILTAFTVSLSAAIASVASLGCSSNGSSFDDAMAGSGPTDPTAATGGNTTTNPAGAMGGNTTTNPAGAMGGNTTNPTSPMGGNDTPGAGTGSGGSGNTAGSGEVPQGGVANNGGTGNTAGTTSQPVCPKPAGQICHEFIANDNGRNVVNYVNEFTSKKAGGVEWSTAVGSTGVNSPRTIEIVDNAKAAGGKAVLVSVNTGYVEIDLANGTKLLEVKAQGTTNVTGAVRLADGTTALGVDTKIVVINASGVPNASGFNLPAGANLRAINLDRATGNYWLSKTETVYQLSSSGQQLWSASMGAGTKGYAVWWRAGGGCYATTGEPATIVEIDANKQIVATIGGRDNPAFNSYKLDFFSGFVRLTNGNYVVANWLGHLGTPAQDTPEILEFKPNGASGEVVWTWGNQTLARQITNVYVIR
jgi:hypothetical protein